jgi:chromosome partitioning protein
MSAKIVSFGNQKGGVGKSTAAMQLAGSLSRRGKKILVVDADEQSTATRWASMSNTTPFPAHVVGLAAAGAKLHRELQKFLDQYELILVDCPPSVSAATPQSAFLVSDLVLIPTRPSLSDIWSVQETIKLVERAKGVNEGIRTAILLNAKQHNTQLGRDAHEVLSAFDAHLLKSTFHLRQAYAQSIVLGSTVHSVPGAKAAQAEVEALADEVLELLEL